MRKVAAAISLILLASGTSSCKAVSSATQRTATKCMETGCLNRAVKVVAKPVVKAGVKVGFKELQKKHCQSTYNRPNCEHGTN